jgi:Pyridoxamine 5'-phosphate oxidase
MPESDRRPRAATKLTEDPGSALDWGTTSAQFGAGHSYWFATVDPTGRPHVRPVLAVVADGQVFTTSSPRARKAQNLRGEPRCSLTLGVTGMDLVVEGVASWVSDDVVLRRVAAAYDAKYGWPVTIVHGAFDAPYGAPTAGPPPYEVLEVRPSRVYAFGIDEEHAPRTTRWDF